MRNPNCSIKCLGLGKIARESGVGTAKGSEEKKEGKSGLVLGKNLASFVRKGIP